MYPSYTLYLSSDGLAYGIYRLTGSRAASCLPLANRWWLFDLKQLVPVPVVADISVSPYIKHLTLHL